MTSNTRSSGAWPRTSARTAQLEALGPVPRRAAVGHRARGLLARTATRWDYFPHDHARSRAYRWGEDGLLGICDRAGPPLLRARALERARPDPQGAALRPDRPGGQPRRGRQGVLLLPRLHADPLLHEGALQVPAGASSPTRGWCEENRRRGQRRARVRAGRHRRLRRRPLLRRLRRVRQGRRRTTS